MNTLILAGLLVSCALYGAIAWNSFKRPVLEGLSRLCRLPRSVQVLLALGAIITTVEAQKSGGSANFRLRDTSAAALVTPQDIKRGYRFVTETADAVLPVPSNAVIVGTWGIHGAVSEFGNHRLDFGNWSFKMGPHERPVSSVWRFPDARIRPTPHDAENEISAGTGPIFAVPGESAFTVADGENGEKILSWNNFRRIGNTNEVISAQIVLCPDGGFMTSTNGVVRIYEPVFPRRWLSLSCPSVLIVGGATHAISGSIDAPLAEPPALTIVCVEGADRIRLDDSESGETTVAGVTKSAAERDVKFEISAEICGETFSVTQALTVAEISRLEMSSSAAGASLQPPPFAGGQPCPFYPNRNPNPGNHLVIPYSAVGDPTTTNVSDFAVNLRLVLDPDITSGFAAEWTVLTNSTGSGQLVARSGGEAVFENPKRGGIVRVAARCDGSASTEGNIVLPLAGASIDGIFYEDVLAASAAVDIMTNTFIKTERESVSWGEKWFNDAGVADYLGRADSSSAQTVWIYNEVNDDSGLGAVATWQGVPTRMSKLSNFLVSYAVEKLGVPQWKQYLSRIRYGTWDNDSAAISWNQGHALAHGGDVREVAIATAQAIWPVADEKERRLWPNEVPADNHSEKGVCEISYNLNFISPAFLRKLQNETQDEEE